MSTPGTARGVGHRDYGAGAVPFRPLRVSGEDSRAAFLPMLDQGWGAATLGLRRPAVGAAGGVDQGVHAARRPAPGGSAASRRVAVSTSCSTPWRQNSTMGRIFN